MPPLSNAGAASAPSLGRGLARRRQREPELSPGQDQLPQQLLGQDEQAPDLREQAAARARERTRSHGRAIPSEDAHAALSWSVQDVFGNSVMQGALSGRLEGPGQAIEGAMTLGAAGVAVADDVGSLLGNSTVMGWLDQGTAADSAAGVAGPADSGSAGSAAASPGPGVSRRSGQGRAQEQFPDDAPRKLDTALGRGGRPMPAQLAARMGAAFGGVDFSGVRIHTDGAAAQAADAIRAHAFATGTDIYFNRGAFSPATPAGQHLLAHELTHVVQHMEGRLRPGGGEGMDVSSPTDPHELEAENTARDVTRALSSGSVDAALDQDALDSSAALDAPGADLAAGVAVGAQVHDAAADPGTELSDGPESGTTESAGTDAAVASGGASTGADGLHRRVEQRRQGRGGRRPPGGGRGDASQRGRSGTGSALDGGLGIIGQLVGRADPAADQILGTLQEIMGDGLSIDGSGVGGLAQALAAAMGGQGGGITQTTPGGTGVGEGPTGPTGGAAGGGGSPSAAASWSVKKGSSGSGRGEGSGAGVRLEGDPAAFTRDLLRTVVELMGAGSSLDSETLWSTMQDRFPDQLDPQVDVGAEGRGDDETAKADSPDSARPDGPQGEQVSGGFRGGGDTTRRGAADSLGFDPMQFADMVVGQFNSLSEGDLGPLVQQVIQGQLSLLVPGFGEQLAQQSGLSLGGVSGMLADASSGPMGSPGESVAMLGGGVPAPAIGDHMATRLGGLGGTAQGRPGADPATGAQDASSPGGVTARASSDDGLSAPRTSPRGGTGSSGGGGSDATSAARDTARSSGSGSGGGGGATAATARSGSGSGLGSGGSGGADSALGAAVQGLQQQTEETGAQATAPEVVDASPETESEEDHDKKVDRFQDGVDGMADLIEDLDAFDDLCDACDDGDHSGQQAALARIRSSSHFRQLSKMWAGAQEGGQDRPEMQQAFDEEFDGRGFWGSTEEAFALVAQAAKQQAAEDAAAKAAKDKLKQAQPGQQAGQDGLATDGGAGTGSADVAGAAEGAGGIDPALLNAVVAQQALPIPGVDALTEVSDEDFAGIAESMTSYEGISQQYDEDGGRFSQVMEALGAGGGVFLETAGETAFMGIIAHFGDKALGGIIGKATGSTIPIVGPAIMLIMDPPWTAEYWDSMGGGIVEGWDSFKSAFDWSVFERADSLTDYVGLICAKLADFLSAIGGWMMQLMRIMNTISALAMLLGGVLLGLGLALLWLAGIGAPLVAAGGWLIDAGLVLGEIGLAILAIAVAANGLALVFRTASAFMVPAELYAEQLGGVEDASENFGRSAGIKVGLSASRAVEHATEGGAHEHSTPGERTVETGRTEGRSTVEETARTVEEHAGRVEELARETATETRTETRTEETRTETRTEETRTEETRTEEHGAERRSVLREIAREFGKNLAKSAKDTVKVRQALGRAIEGFRDLGNINSAEGLRQVQGSLDGKVAEARETLGKAEEYANGLRSQLEEGRARFEETARELEPGERARIRGELESLREGLQRADAQAARLQDRVARWERTKAGADQNRYEGPTTGKGELAEVETRLRTSRSELEATRSRQGELTERLSRQDQRIAELEQSQSEFRTTESQRLRSIEENVDLQRSRRAAEEVDAHNATLEQARQDVARLREQGLDRQADFIEQTRLQPNEAPAEQNYWQAREAEAQPWRNTETGARENPFDAQLEAAKAERSATYDEFVETIDAIEAKNLEITDLRSQARSGRIDAVTKRADEKWREKTVEHFGGKHLFELALHTVEGWIHALTGAEGGEHEADHEADHEAPAGSEHGGEQESKFGEFGSEGEDIGHEGTHHAEVRSHIDEIGNREAWLEQMMHRAPPADLEQIKAARAEAIAEAEQAMERHAAAFQAYVAEQAVSRMADDTATLIAEGEPLREQARSMAGPLQQARSDEEQRTSTLQGGSPEEIEGSDEQSSGLIGGLIERLASHSDDLSQQPDMGGADGGNMTQGQDEASEAAQQHTESARGFSDTQRGILDEAIEVRSGQEQRISSDIDALHGKHAEEQEILARIQARKAQALAEEQAHRATAQERAREFNDGYSMLSTWSTWFDEGLEAEPGGH